MAFWVSAGVRASELLGATQEDADPGQQLITVVRKGSRALQPVPASVGVLIAEAAVHRAAGPLHLWVPTTCVTWADALPSAVPRPVPGEPVLVRPNVG